MLVILTMQMGMILCYSFKPPDQQKLIILTMLSVGKEEEQGEPSYATQWECNQGNHSGMQFNIEAEHNIRPSNCILCKCFRETVKFTFRQLLECTLEHCLQWRKRKRNSLNQQRVHEWIVVFLCNGIPSIEESSMCNNVGEPQDIILSEKSKLWNNIQNDTIYVKFIIM